MATQTWTSNVSVTLGDGTILTTQGDGSNQFTVSFDPVIITSMNQVKAAVADILQQIAGSSLVTP